MSSRADQEIDFLNVDVENLADQVKRLTKKVNDLADEVQRLTEEAAGEYRKGAEAMRADISATLDGSADRGGKSADARESDRAVSFADAAVVARGVPVRPYPARTKVPA